MKRIVKILLLIVALPVAAAALLFAVGAYLYLTADFRMPDVAVDMEQYTLAVDTQQLKVCQGSSLRLNEYGLWEAYIAGDATERGATYGLMSQSLIRQQEDTFVARMHELVPSDLWVEWLHKLIIIFNRDMARHIPDQFREEICAMSHYCTEEYNRYGSPYVRQLNFHAAHDIGHAIQQYMLVGCSSFACWGADSQSGELIVGRNFDFYLGDDFAKNRFVLFVEPDEGYRFASISWAGMMGVLSGMNECGLTVTINAAKGDIPTGSAMPISLLARQILQYAANIEQAYAIAQQAETFVSESLLIASAADGYAAIIEKTPERMALYRSDKSNILCTNHYQSPDMDDDHNRQNIATSDSPYRYARLGELVAQYAPVDAADAVQILRNRYGLQGEDIGIGNEKSINQFIAHHSVVFEPKQLRFWVSTAPWQSGEYICYDLRDVFARQGGGTASYVKAECNIAADSTAIADECRRVVSYREDYKRLAAAIAAGESVDCDFITNFISNNPNYFQVYNIVGDYYLSVVEYDRAVEHWRLALQCEVTRQGEVQEIERKIEEYDKK
ncbi:MAG: choloylglycine hydrolase [Alistipes sp.]|nr:choloylglycine hydrolase [Alistipes sp.]